MPSLPIFHEKANLDKPFVLLLGIRQLNTSHLRAMKDRVLLRYPKYQGTVDHTGILKTPRLKVPSSSIIRKILFTKKLDNRESESLCDVGSRRMMSVGSHPFTL